MAEPVLSVSSLCSGYGDIQILWDVDLHVGAGEITCLIGSNGAGKTTLMRTISGLLRSTAGTVRFDGRDLTNAPADAVVDAGIAHVPEGRRLFRGLTVRDNLLLGAYRRRDKAGIEADIEKMFSLFPILGDRQKQDATTMSGGEQQMCAIARGIMSRPKLLMIDELTLGLAPGMVERLCEALVRINAEGLPILLVEQDVMTAFELARHVFVLETGRTVKSGEVEALSNDPAIRQAYLGV